MDFTLLHVYKNYLPMIPPMRGGKVTLPPYGCKVITLYLEGGKVITLHP